MTTYYLDAYNIIHGSDSLRAVAQKSIGAARDALIKMVESYCTQSSQEEVVVVFDGRGDPSMSAKSASKVGNLRIAYCEGTISADAYIERAVFKTRKRLNVVVVTADSTVAQLVRGMGALVLKLKLFLEQIESSRFETRGRMAVRKRNQFGTGLSARLDEQSQAELRALRADLSSQNDRPNKGRRTKKRRAGPKTGS